MSNRQEKLIRPLTGSFLGWGDDRTPHRYIKLATMNGEHLIKVAKSLRPQIQDWQPGIWLALLTQEQICRSTGKTKIKVKQLLTLPCIAPVNNRPSGSPSPSKIDGSPVKPTKIQVCQGSTCRRRGSDKICRLMAAYVDRHDLNAAVQIESVKCLHQCKAAPHAIVTSPAGAILPGKTHYRQVQSSQMQAILAKHFPIVSQPKLSSTNLIAKIGAYLQQNQISTSIPL
ncbi:(2Fe-2S) ferredoxin domain-containing protein [Chamaesiphon sp. VAR_48_metabat_135_sub]|uniref:(2Fe-2S) ferredoxin domain-containing protein n=1 Tax=Chamaesiphon sp. VAR_48_metabat_135_sub TaxID=2964699 RepID=UPI00286B3B7E|nr:(2Fe-2S) ferredoxin domain-containing protein [Chamaesiphon sp. VAR_48_metabat_135_sub]